MPLPLPADFLRRLPPARLVIVCFMALAVGLSMALISLAKLLLFVGGGLVLVGSLLRSRQRHTHLPATPAQPSTWLILAALAVFTLTLAWTSAPEGEALSAIGKHGKLLVVPLLVLLLRTRREALLALGWYAAGQLFLLGSSWALAFHLRLPWATSRSAVSDYSVFSTYLDQSIMTALFAALCWHLRGLLASRAARIAAVCVALAAVANVVGLLQGRTGHVVAIAMVSLAILWELPQRWRLAGLLVPFLVLGIVAAGSAKVRDRLVLVGTEVTHYNQDAQIETSSSQRLNFWHRALQAIAERPLAGHGAGSWNTEYNRLEGGRARAHTDVVRNPHQEYLLWGVEAGIGALLLFVALLACLWREAGGAPRDEARAARSAVAAVAVACLFNSSLFDAQMGDYFCVALGLTLALALRSGEPQPSREAAAAAAAAVV